MTRKIVKLKRMNLEYGVALIKYALGIAMYTIKEYMHVRVQE